MTGRPDRVPAVVPYDDGWPAWFEDTRRELQPVLDPWTVTPIEHIGSTAIPGMPAKPLLDLMVGVADLDAAARAAGALEERGWERRTHRVDAVLAVSAEDGVDRVNLQLTVPGTDLWRERLTFRDALRSDARLVTEYAELKRRLLRDSGGGPYRAADKREFVRRVLDGAGVTLRDDRHASSR